MKKVLLGLKYIRHANFQRRKEDMKRRRENGRAIVFWLEKKKAT